MILGIETATARLSIALHDGERVHAAININRGNAHDELLVPLCRDLIAHANLSMEELRGVAVSAGPGSFTGLRIGMAAAKGIAFGRSLPLFAIPTLDAAAETVARSWHVAEGCMLAVCMDAKRGDVYIATYALETYRWTKKRETRVVPSAELPASLPDGILLAGDAAESVSMASPDRFRLLSDAAAVFDARSVAALGARMISEGRSSDIDNCEPLYIRAFEIKEAKPLLSRM
ncbi:MAG: tRNA (adenosine(37)-N6)-threonylcarbamoyltransferase complex dimerization subunit type 1 TsaB [Bacteroidetes bacterium]|nr:tRNA (adenosine(37)-N6)-threonylcarbamoyltransferase complex dimerization subunit type 1 TsaB [Bacteroidota bacterium]